MKKEIEKLLKEKGFLPLEMRNFKPREAEVTMTTYYEYANEDNEWYLEEFKQSIKDMELIREQFIPVLNKYIALGYISVNNGKKIQTTLNIINKAIRELQLGELEGLEERK